MAHVKAGGGQAHQKANVVGKHRGLKVNQGQVVRGGQILVRQTGITYKGGVNTKLSRDSSVVSRVEGTILFSYLRRPNGVRTVINVIPKAGRKISYTVMVGAKKSAVKAEKVEKTVKAPAEKKAVVKKTVAKKVAK